MAGQACFKSLVGQRGLWCCGCLACAKSSTFIYLIFWNKRSVSGVAMLYNSAQLHPALHLTSSLNGLSPPPLLAHIVSTVPDCNALIRSSCGSVDQRVHSRCAWIFFLLFSSSSLHSALLYRLDVSGFESKPASCGKPIPRSVQGCVYFSSQRLHSSPGEVKAPNTHTSPSWVLCDKRFFSTFPRHVLKRQAGNEHQYNKKNLIAFLFLFFFNDVYRRAVGYQNVPFGEPLIHFNSLFISEGKLSIVDQELHSSPPPPSHHPNRDKAKVFLPIYQLHSPYVRQAKPLWRRLDQQINDSFYSVV